MKNALICLSLVVLTTWLGQPPAQASAPLGHYVSARRVVDAIKTGKKPAPPELKEALEDPEFVWAFCGGAVAPDIVPEQSHYGNSEKLTKGMIEAAHADLKAAKKNNDPKAIKKAQKELAFAYGWLTHAGSDLAVHPKINGTVGDAYDYGGAAGKLKHAALEVQLDQFLWKNFRKGNEGVAIDVPYDFLYQFAGSSVESLKFEMGKLKAKGLGADVLRQNITLTNDQLSKAWKQTVNEAFEESFQFIADPKRLQDWDWDCGKLSSEEFKLLRQATMQANGGKLPADWGKNYMQYYDMVKDLFEEKKQQQVQKDPVDFKLPAFPKVHEIPNEADRYNIEKWRDNCIVSLNKQMEEDPERAKNRDECLKIPHENREMTCSKCGFAGVHWWIEPSWSCPSCEFCTMPQDVKRADGMTYREFAAAQMKIYQDKITEIEKKAQDALNRK